MVTIHNNYVSGRLNNTMFFKDEESLTLKSVLLTGHSYNDLMTGQQCKPGKYIKTALIQDCDFNAQCRHINIWFAAWQDEAVLTIKNCHFATCEQFLCLSDFHAQHDQNAFNNRLTINIENCTIDNYETGANDIYEGIILCDARQTPSGELAVRNPFGNGKVVINISNLKVKTTAAENYTQITQENFLMGTHGPGQMLYVYHATAPAGSRDIAFDANLYPTVNVLA